MEIEDFETVHLAQELARARGWEHVKEAIREALRCECDALDRRPPRLQSARGTAAS